MKKIEAIVRPYKVEIIKNELNKAGIRGMTVTSVEGFGKQGGHTEVYRDTELCVSFVPKSKIEIVLEDSKVDMVIKLLMEHGKSGHMGDGKIFVLPVENVIKIRTGETGEKAL